MSIRSMEKAMGVGDSVFNKVLKGKITLQLRHVLMIRVAERIGERPRGSVFHLGREMLCFVIESEVPRLLPVPAREERECRDKSF